MNPMHKRYQVCVRLDSLAKYCFFDTFEECVEFISDIQTKPDFENMRSVEIFDLTKWRIKL